jgi:hypothetical protein
MSLAVSSTFTAPAASSRMAATVAFTGGLISLALVPALAIVRPDLAPGAHVMSEYAIGYAPLGILFFVSQSVGCLGLAIALAGVADTRAMRAGIWLLLAAAFGLGLAVFCPMDPLTTPAGQETMQGNLHGVSALIGIPSFIAATLVLASALKKKPEWRSAGSWLTAFAHATWIGLVLMIVCMVLLLTQGVTVMGELVGYANRLLVIAYALFLMIAAAPLLKR